MKTNVAVQKNAGTTSKLAELKLQMKQLRDAEREEREANKATKSSNKIETTLKYINIFKARAERMEERRLKALALVKQLEDRLKKQQAEAKHSEKKAA